MKDTTTEMKHVFNLLLQRVRVMKRFDGDDKVVFKTLTQYRTKMPPKSALLEKWKKYGFVKNVSYKSIPNDTSDHPFRDMYVYFELTDDFINRYTYELL